MKKKKRIVIDASSCLIGSWSKNLSGIGRTTLELIRTLETIPELPFELHLFCQRLRQDRLQRYSFRSPQHCLPLPRQKWTERLKNLCPVVETLTGADLYHIPHNHSGFFAGKRTLLTIHDAMMFEMREDHLFDKDEQNRLRRAAMRCQAILTCSQSSKQLLLKHLDIPEEKITVAPWGYNSDIFHEIPSDQVKENLVRTFQITNPYLFSVSCNIGRKRTPELIRQYLTCCLQDDYPYDLVLVWENIPDVIVSLINKHSAGRRIKILKGVSDQELALLYNGSVCTVFPSTYEGFGLPIWESMACGTPVLTTRETSMPEIAEEAGIYFNSLDENDIGCKLDDLGNNKFDLQEKHERSLIQAQKFNYFHERLNLNTLFMSWRQ